MASGDCGSAAVEGSIFGYASKHAIERPGDLRAGWHLAVIQRWKVLWPGHSAPASAAERDHGFQRQPEDQGRLRKDQSADSRRGYAVQRRASRRNCQLVQRLADCWR